MVVVVMGVSAAGKTVVGRALAARLGVMFADADDYHSRANVDRMRAGHALTDEDRAPWLAALRVAIDGWLAAGTSAVLACSALKRAYRDVLRQDGVRFVYLDVDRATLVARLAARHDHFMPAALLDSQLATLERPAPDEAITVDGTRPVEDVVASIVSALG